jgi:uncharacterized membrane protein YhaH (DUF805 family)
MHCGNCGKDRKETTNYCTNCGFLLNREFKFQDSILEPNLSSQRSDNSTPKIIGFSQAVEFSYENWRNFNGRASRSEFWYYFLFNFLVIIGINPLLALFSFLMEEDLESLSAWIVFPFLLFSIIPSAASITRRLHDIGKSGINVLWSIIPFGGIVLLIWYCRPGNPHSNRYGPPIHADQTASK